MKTIDRKLLFHLVDVVWSEAFEDESVPSTTHARKMIVKAIERRRHDKYSSEVVTKEMKRKHLNP